MTTIEDKQRIAKHLLLSSAPGQFNLILADLQTILNSNTTNTNDEESSHVLSQDWINQVRQEYESITGRYILKGDSTTSPNTNISNKMKELEEELREHLSNYYSSKGVTSNIIIQPPSGDDGTYTILLYAERIQLQHYHAGSWTSTYTIDITNSKLLDGKSIIHAHTFENGNLQMTHQSQGPLSSSSLTATTRPTSIKSKPTSTSISPMKQIIQQIEQWEEQHVMQPLEELYTSMSDEILKKMRRIMPVTRTKFDWNVANHRFVKMIGLDVQKK